MCESFVSLSWNSSVQCSKKNSNIDFWDAPVLIVIGSLHDVAKLVPVTWCAKGSTSYFFSTGLNNGIL